VRLEAPPGSVLEIDGYPHSPPYEGWYLRGMEMRARLADDGGQSCTWKVEDEQHHGCALYLTVSSETTARLLLRGPG
jgi:hypothetical protein